MNSSVKITVTGMPSIESGKNRSRTRILVYIYHDGRFAIASARGPNAGADHARLEHQVRTMVLEHCRGAIRCLFWKLCHQILESGDEGLSSPLPDLLCVIGLLPPPPPPKLNVRPIASAESGQHYADRICNRGSAAACEKQTNGIV